MTQSSAQYAQPATAGDDDAATPGIVIGAVAAGTVVVPFLMIYAFLFLVHGLFVNVEQPDISSSRSGEAVAGAVAFAFLLLVVWGITRLLNRADGWLFALGQLLTAGVAATFVLRPSSGEPTVPAVVFVAAIAAITLSLLPPARRWMRPSGSDPSDAIVT